MPRQTGVLLAACVLFIAGCVSIPVKSPTKDIRQDELAQDVRFLTQPALKGRKAGSWESPAVRRFLIGRFKQYGLIPWAQCKTYEQKFRFGTNVIGVMPGSDPNLANEIVLVSAHYDHAGVQEWKVCPGACDNASGVAAMLEIAESLSQSETKPKRTICFASFDAEEMYCLGSFAFTCRDDYDDSKIVTVINMDLLGRDLLDVVDHSLFVTGTENYARIEDKVSAACTQNDLKFIPLGSDLIGPVGDHIAFTSSRRPVLFFTCGINKDYHQPTDTADKLNFSKLKQESVVIEQILLALANTESQLLDRSVSPITQQTVDSFLYILDKFKENHKTFKLDPNDIKLLDEIITKTKQYDPNTMTRDRLLCIERESIGKLLKLLKHYDKTVSQHSEYFIWISGLFAMQPEAVTHVYRRMIGHYVNHKPSLFKKNNFAYQINLPMTDQDWGIVKTGPDEFIFGAVNTEISLETKIYFLKGYRYTFLFGNKLTACKGSLSQIVDYAFFGKDPNGLLHDTHQAYYVLGAGNQIDNGGLSEKEVTIRREKLWSEFRAAIEQHFPEEALSEKFQKYNDPNIFPGDPNSSCVCQSIFITIQPPQINKESSTKMSTDYSIKLIRNTSEHVEDRVDAIFYLAYLKNKITLTAIADALNDQTPYAMKLQIIDNPNFPLKDHPYVRESRSRKEKQFNELKDKTLGQIARESLKKVTKKDFGTDKQAWQEWIKKHY